MKVITSITIFNDAVGVRLSASYSEIDEQGQVISDNNRVDRVITDKNVIAITEDLKDYAQSLLQ